MNFKTEWLPHLHTYRKRELEMVFLNLEKQKYATGLELGAGDGFQSNHLIEYIDQLTATDLNKDRLPKSTKHERIKFQVSDAEQIGAEFNDKEFDIIYSSNLMEHLPNVEECFNGIRKILKDDGLSIHIMPSPWWRFFATALHFPNKFNNILVRLTSDEIKSSDGSVGNNIKIERDEKRWIDHIIPKPHGISNNSFTEFFAFKKSKWIKTFEACGFEVFKVEKGPVSSGYGFGFDRIRKVLEQVGIATEYIYYTRKK